jgi:hypothetical protein
MSAVPKCRPMEPRHPFVRALLPPLTIALAVVSASALLLTAAAIVPPPLTGAAMPPTPRATMTGTPRLDAELTALVRTVNIELPPAPAVVDLARLSYAPDEGGQGPALPGPFLVVVESGLLAVHLDGAGQVLRAAQPTVAAPEPELVLRPGDGLVLPTATTAAFRNAGSAPVIALAAGIFPSGVSARKFGRVGLAAWGEHWSPGASVQSLAGGWLVHPASGSAAMALQRLSLPAGASLPLTAPGPLDLAGRPAPSPSRRAAASSGSNGLKARTPRSRQETSPPCCPVMPPCCKRRPTSPCATTAVARSWCSP